MKLLKSIIVCSLVVTLFSCEKEDDCVGCNLNPKIKLEFEATGTRQLYDSLLETVNAKIIILSDSLITNITEETRKTFVDELVELRIDSTKYDDAISLYSAGKAGIDQIEALGAEDGFIQFQDSIVRDFSIPVNMSSDTSTYYFSYHELVDTLQVYYQREITQTLDGVRMQLTDIGVNEEMTTFDSIKVKCYNRECGNDLTTIHVYF